ncbi:hypothetical protein [Paenibacillus silviterrae]|uniref:hypothetical protein n=1 Tax=Paenibacillus silviterrae TaxID=3242194 RepID=UPI002543EE12|nr:hypothetical protein [Paenibacillus chinjuensis]
MTKRHNLRIVINNTKKSTAKKRKEGTFVDCTYVRLTGRYFSGLLSSDENYVYNLINLKSPVDVSEIYEKSILTWEYTAKAISRLIEAELIEYVTN